MAGGINPFVYALNNPVNWIDPYGLKPGDKFNTMDEAAIDSIEYIFNNKSDSRKFEYGGFLYKTEDNNFSYTVPVRGTENAIEKCDLNTPPAGLSSEAIYHTHPGRGYNVFWFSTYDYIVASDQPIYLGAKGGYKIKVWDSQNGEKIIRPKR